MYIVLGGAGQQGRAIVRYLEQHTSEKIYSVDPANAKATVGQIEYCNINPNNRMTRIGVCAPDIKDSVIISCLRPELTLPILSELNKVGCRGFLDLGGDDKVTQKVRNYVTNSTPGLVRNTYTVVPDCGLAPGLPSSIAGQAVKQGEKHVQVFCGGLPAKPYFGRCRYLKSFSMEGLYGELMGPTESIVGGTIVHDPSLYLTFPRKSIRYDSICGLEASNTSGGLSDTCLVLKDKLVTLVYFTLRANNHWDFLKKHILWRTREDAINVMDKIFQPVSVQDQDLIILQAQYGAKVTEWTWEYDSQNNISAMAQATGYTAAAVATIIHDGVLPMGLVGMHDIDLNEIIRRARKEPGQFIEN